MASGIAIAQECVDAHKGIVARKLNTIILKIADDLQEIVVEKKFSVPEDDDIEESWKKITESVSDNDCRMIISDFLVRETPTVIKSRMVFISWNPEDAPVKNKM